MKQPLGHTLKGNVNEVRTFSLCITENFEIGSNSSSNEHFNCTEFSNECGPDHY